MADLAEGMPDKRYLELFKIKYDYHNAKALLKAEAVGVPAGRMLMDMGRVPAAALAEAIRDLNPQGMGRNKQLVAGLVRRRWFGLLSLMYAVKNRR